MNSARLGDGIVPGRKVLKFWGVERRDHWRTYGKFCRPMAARIRTLSPGSKSSSGTGMRGLSTCPGTYFLEVVEKLYKRNELATGSFVALGQRIDLAAVKSPIFLLAASEDELVAPAQLFAVERLVGTAAGNIKKITLTGRHVALFMGKKVLEEIWPISSAGFASRR